MSNPRYKAFVEVAGTGSISNREFIEFINQMHRLYAAQEGGGPLFSEEDEAFDEFVKANAHLYAPADPGKSQVSGSIIDQIACAFHRLPDESDAELMDRWTRIVKSLERIEP